MSVEISEDAFSRLTLASEFLEPLRWDYDGRCLVGGFGERDINAHWDFEGRGEVDDHDRKIWQIGLNARAGGRFPGLTVFGPDGTWGIEYAIPISHEGVGNGAADSTQLNWNRMWHRVSQCDVAVRVLLVPKPLRILFPDRLPIVPGVFGRHTGENGLRSRLFGRDALFRNVTIDDRPCLAIAYDGGALDELQVVSILTVLGFLVGHDVDACAQIMMGSDGKLVERDLVVPHVEPEHTPTPAVNCIDGTTVATVSSSLESMVARAHELRFAKDVPIDVAIKYLQRWNGNQLDLEIRDVTSALNVIIESPGFSPDNGRLVDAEMFKHICARLDKTIELLSSNVPQELHERLRERIREANAVTTKERRRRLWTTVGFEPTKAERAALRHRNVMSHKGFIETRSTDEERSLLDDIALARTLVNETILTLIGYSGLLLDYSTGLRPMRGQH